MNTITATTTPITTTTQQAPGDDGGDAEPEPQSDDHDGGEDVQAERELLAGEAEDGPEAKIRVKNLLRILRYYTETLAAERSARKRLVAELAELKRGVRSKVRADTSLEVKV